MSKAKNPNRFPDDAYDLMINKAEFDRKYTIEPNTGCWLWTGMLHRQGYGFIAALRKSDNKVIMCTAHRISFRIHTGPITKPNINHKCHTPGCVSPYHLYEGTQKENVQDAVNAGAFSRPRKKYRPRAKKMIDTYVQTIGSKKQNRPYKYSEEDIQFCRSQSLDDIQTRFGVNRRKASGLRYECVRLYNWLPFVV